MSYQDPTKRIDYIGKRFGRWTVIGSAPDIEYSSPKKTRQIQFNCKCDCGTIRNVPKHHLRSGNSKSCGCLFKDSRKRGSDHHCWKGGTQKAGKYIRLQMPTHHRANNHGYVLEHIIVMEKKIGRKLIDRETVHHINGVGTDNRPENLELWSSAHPPGQRIEDKVLWAKDILRLYEPSSLSSQQH